MKRKDFLATSALAASAALLASGCNSLNEEQTGEVNPTKKFKWKMVTTWPPNFPVLGEVANQIAQWIFDMSAGRLDIKVYGSNELVPALEVFDTVAMNTCEMGCGVSYYWAGKIPAAPFFAAVPFGMNAQQTQSWLLSGGGMELWKQVYAPFNLEPLIGGNTGVQMGGWFNKEIKTIDDLRGLKMRIPGIAGRVLEKAGGAALLVAGSELYTSLERGVIDATEWIGPYHDSKMGFNKVAKYYYSPGWHEPGGQLEFFANTKAMASLPADLQAIVRMASYRAQAWVLSEFDAQNATYLNELVNEKGVELRTFPDEILRELKHYSVEVLEELAKKDELTMKVFTHYMAFKEKTDPWYEATEKAYYNKILSLK